MVNVSASINANLGVRFRSLTNFSVAAAALIATCGVAQAADGTIAAISADAALDAAMPVAEGGPFMSLASKEGGAAAEAATADAQYRTLFQTWKKLDTIETTVISVPSMQPVDKLLFTSSFGVRSDPFKGTAAMHAGVDIPGAIGTPIYATADGVISHAGRQGGYGNLVQINHGRGIETRYGHLSKIIVADHSRVKRGQLIGLMGSTGRSTGSHLHYEVRVDGKAVNPIPFLQTGEYVAQLESQGAVGGPLASK